MNVISRIIICVKREIRELQFYPFFCDSEWKTCRFHVKLLKLWEFGMNGNSRHWIEVKCDSVKCWKSLLSLNFPWTWIHWHINSILLKLAVLLSYVKSNLAILESQKQPVWHFEEALNFNFEKFQPWKNGPNSPKSKFRALEIVINGILWDSEVTKLDFT